MKYPLLLIEDNGLARNDPDLLLRLQRMFDARGVAPTIAPPRPGAPSQKPGRVLGITLALLPQKKPPAPELLIAEQPVTVEAEVEFDADMLHGVIDVGTIDGAVLHQFQPTRVCANVNDLPFAFQDSAKLALEQSQYPTIKPGNFSGLMKRCAQAVLGVGIVTDSSPDFFSGVKPDPVVSTSHPLQYDYRFARTHGIYKAAEKNHWLVEISSANGVLAMPLPLFRNTMTQRYRTKVNARGDTDTLAVLDEYGGIPTGAAFPAGDLLATAIANGSVLQLLAPADLADFYGKSQFSAAWGWAFNSDGTRCDNTCWEILTSDTWIGYRKTYHYSLALTLSAHDSTTRPVGSGSATLSLISSGIIFAPWYETFGERKSDACLFVPDTTLTRVERFRLTANTSLAPELTTADATLVKGLDSANFFGMALETRLAGTLDYVPFPPPGGFPQINSDIGNAPVFVFFNPDDTLEKVLYGTDNTSENYNTLWSATIDRRVWETSPRKAGHTLFIGLPHCREGWAALTHIGTDRDPDATWDSEVHFELYTARGGLQALTPPTGYVDPPDEPETDFPSDAYTAIIIEYRIGDLEFSDFFPTYVLFDVNENGGVTDGYIRHNTIHFDDADVVVPDNTVDHSGEDYVRLNARDIPLAAIVTKDVNWVGHV